jgi:hypothetical protein
MGVGHRQEQNKPHRHHYKEPTRHARVGQEQSGPHRHHYKKPTKHVGLEQSRPHPHLIEN